MGITKLVPGVLALGSVAFAQTYTACDPTKTTCPVDAGFTQPVYTVDFTKGEDTENWRSVGTGKITYGGESGAAFTIEKEGDAPTLDSTRYLFFGSVSVVCKAAAGAGIVSSVVLQSDTLDEIDWEWTGGDGFHVQTNYFGKGNTTAYDRGFNPALANPQQTYYNYTIDWTAERIQWLIDGSVVRTLQYAEALGGQNYPQTPAVVKLGNWAGGAAGNSPGTIQWAGGPTDFSKAPFVMNVKSVTIRNANPAVSYEYGDRSGSYKSIKKSDKKPDVKPVTPIDPASLGDPAASEKPASSTKPEAKPEAKSPASPDSQSPKSSKPSPPGSENTEMADMSDMDMADMTVMPGMDDSDEPPSSSGSGSASGHGSGSGSGSGSPKNPPSHVTPPSHVGSGHGTPTKPSNCSSTATATTTATRGPTTTPAIAGAAAISGGLAFPVLVGVLATMFV